MSRAIGLIEYKTVPKGIEGADAMLKAADVSLVFSSPICPGKYISIISGEVDAVSTAVAAGEDVGGVFLVGSWVLPNVHEKIFPALTGSTSIDKIKSLGIVETMSAISSVQAGDAILKAASVELIEIRIARGLGGKGFVVFTGELGSVESAMRACESKLSEDGSLISASVIPSPHKALLEAIL